MVRFETGGFDLVDMITNPMEWPAFAIEIEMYQRLQEDFEDDLSILGNMGSYY